MVDAPIASVLVGARGRPALLELALWTYARQQTCRFEVIVAIDGCTDSLAVVERMQAHMPYSLRSVWQDHHGYRRSRLLNLASLLSTTPSLIVADDDCLVNPRFVQAHVAALAGHEVSFGRCIHARAHVAARMTLPLVRDQAWWRYCAWRRPLVVVQDVLRLRVQLVTPSPVKPALSGNNFAIRRATWQALNGLDHDFVGWGYEDNDLRRRLHVAGASLGAAGIGGWCLHMGTDERATPVARGTENLAMALDPTRPARCVRGLDSLADERASQYA